MSKRKMILFLWMTLLFDIVIRNAPNETSLPWGIDGIIIGVLVAIFAMTIVIEVLTGKIYGK